LKRVKKVLSRFLEWEYAGLCLLVLLVLVLHLALILRPGTPVFDEQYYVPDARSILQGTGSERIEHPPLGKLIIAGGMAIFGDNPFGWRIMSVFFGLACVVLFYLICRRLKLSKRASFLATFILALENLSFIQAGIAMLDVFSLAFTLAAFWLYLKNRHVLSAAAVGLAALVKLTGLLALPVIVLYWLLASRKSALRFSISMLAAPAIFFILMPVLDLAIWHKWLNPLHQLSVMFNASSTATFAAYPSPMLSRPWDWVLRPEILTYWTDPQYVGMISPDLWVLIVPVMLYAFYRAAKKNIAAIFSAVWFICLYVLWIPFSLISDRISYVYYFYPAIGAVCLGIGVWADVMFAGSKAGRPAWLERLVIPVFVLAHLAAFAVLAPVSYWWKVPCCVALYILARYELSSPANRPSEIAAQI
jgi:predicted membrane-bound dolichyl-phosphate-mannose-protein mannosyltransferase